MFFGVRAWRRSNRVKDMETTRWRVQFMEGFNISHFLAFLKSGKDYRFFSIHKQNGVLK